MARVVMLAWGKTARDVVTQLPISRFPTPELADLPQDIRERIEAVQEKSGFVPNVFLALARRNRTSSLPLSSRTMMR